MLDDQTLCFMILHVAVKIQCNVLKATGINSKLHFSWGVTNTAQEKVLLAKVSMLYSSTNL